MIRRSDMAKGVPQRGIEVFTRCVSCAAEPRQACLLLRGAIRQPEK